MSDDLYAGDNSSGLLTHFVGRVNKGLWSTIFAESQGQTTGDFAQNTMLFWHVGVLDILQANYEAKGAPVESILTSFGIGNGWHQTPDDPNLVEHEDDTDDYKKKFHASSALMRFVYLVSGENSAYEGTKVLDGDDENYSIDLSGVRQVHAQKGVKTLRDASIWDGMIFEFRGLGTPTRDRPNPRAKALPVRYVGYEESEVTDLSQYVQQTSTTNSAGASTRGLGTPEQHQVDQWISAGASGATVDILSRLHASSPSYEAFKGNAAMIGDVKDNEELLKAINNPEPF